MAEQVTTSTLSDIRCFDVLRYSANTLVGHHRYASFIQEQVVRVWQGARTGAAMDAARLESGGVWR